MRAALIAPVIPPPGAPTHRAGTAGARAGVPAMARALPTASPPLCPVLPGDIVYGLARLDASGRICDRALIDVLGWRVGDRLLLAATGAFVLIRRDHDGL